MVRSLQAQRVHHRLVAGVEPAAGKGLGVGGAVCHGAFCDRVAAKKDLAHRLAVRPHRQQGQRARTATALLYREPHVLAAVHQRAFGCWQRGPGCLFGADRSRVVDHGQAEGVGQLDAGDLAAFDHGRGRLRAGDQAVQGVADALAQRSGRVDQHAVGDGRAAQVDDVVLADPRVDQRRIHPAQAHTGASNQRHRPREAPAVAVEHRQRPQADRVVRQARADDVAGRIEVGTAVVRDHALGVAGGTRATDQRNRGSPVGEQLPGVLRGAFGQQGFAAQVAMGDAGGGSIVVNLDHQQALFAQQ